MADKLISARVQESRIAGEMQLTCIVDTGGAFARRDYYALTIEQARALIHELNIGIVQATPAWGEHEHHSNGSGTQ